MTPETSHLRICRVLSLTETHARVLSLRTGTELELLRRNIQRGASLEPGDHIVWVEHHFYDRYTGEV